MARKNVIINQEEVSDNFLLNEENQIDDLMPSEQVEIKISDPDAPYVYIKKSILGYYCVFPKMLKEEDFNNLGTTYEDFKEDKWVLLSKEQVQFHNENPSASIKEVLDMKRNTVPEPTYEEQLQRAKSNKLMELNNYDNSSAINEFVINEELRTWFTPEQRANYKNSIDSAKLLNIESLQLLVDNNLLEIPTYKAEKLLAMIQLYADTCYIVTKQHEQRISQLETLQEVEEYDFTAGYPEKLNFEI